jgi:hypothetical protein
MAANHEYLFLTLEGGRAAHAALSERLAEAGPVITSAGGEVLGQFSPQLGWASHEAAVLLRWNGEATGRDEARATISGAPVTASRRADLTPTIRPSEGARLRRGGIYVHRWFTVSAGSLAEFVDLSGQAWPDFEARFDADIFGLFQAAPTATEAAAGEVSLLLITRYGDHGVWEASREPNTEAMQIFARRQALTLRTQAASTLLVGS